MSPIEIPPNAEVYIEVDRHQGRMEIRRRGRLSPMATKAYIGQPGDRIEYSTFWWIDLSASPPIRHVEHRALLNDSIYLRATERVSEEPKTKALNWILLGATIVLSLIALATILALVILR